MKNDKLLDAISGIDADILEEHLKMKEKAKQKTHRSPWFKASAIAACLCLILTVSLLINQILFIPPEDTGRTLPPENTLGSDISAPNITVIDDNFYDAVFSELCFYDGDEAFSMYGFITHMGYGENSIFLKIEKLTDGQVSFNIHGEKKGETLTYWGYFPEKDENYNIEDRYTVPNAFEVFVNGEKVSEIPSEPGIYDVEIRFSVIKNACDTLDPYIDISFEHHFVDYNFSTDGKGYGISISGGKILYFGNENIYSFYPVAKDIKARVYDSDAFGGMYMNGIYDDGSDERKLVIYHVGEKEALLEELRGIIDGTEDYIIFEEVEYSHKYLRSVKEKVRKIIRKLGADEETAVKLNSIVSYNIDTHENSVVITVTKEPGSFPYLFDPAEFGLTQEEYYKSVKFIYRAGHLY